jgi:hypothetical protein
MSTNDERAKDAEALFVIASAAWNQHRANCRVTTASGSLQKVCEAISAHLAARLDSLAGEVAHHHANAVEHSTMALHWQDRTAAAERERDALAAELHQTQRLLVAATGCRHEELQDLKRAEAELARVREWIALANATHILDPSERFGFQSAVGALTAHMALAAKPKGEL